MIVSKQETLLRCVTQPDHARLAAEILSLWRTDGLPEHPRRNSLLFATREHDNGWREVDSAPRIRPDGAPCTFLDVPDPLRKELWIRGTERYASEEPYAALLITRHAMRLHADRLPQPDASPDDATAHEPTPWDEFFAALRDRVEELSAATEAAEDEADADAEWLALADGLSLRACGALGDTLQTDLVTATRRGSELAIDPFPLAGATTFSVPCRHIPDRHYESDTDLAMELARARWTEFRIRVVGV